MINLRANENLKTLGCKWDGKEWIAPKLAQKEAIEIKKKFYSDLISVEFTMKEDGELKRERWGYSEVNTVAGYIVATVSGRDSGAKIQDGIAVISGKFISAGSIKNFYCDHTSDLVFRMEISKNALDDIELEGKDRYKYKILEQEEEQEGLEDLLTKQKELEKELQELNEKIIKLKSQKTN